MPIHEHFLPELLRRHTGHRLQFSTSVKEALLAVRSRLYNCRERPNRKPEKRTCRSSKRSLMRLPPRFTPRPSSRKEHVPVRTCDSLRKTLLLNGAESDLFAVASNPEFLREGTAVTDFLYPDRIVIGADDQFSAPCSRKSIVRSLPAAITARPMPFLLRTTPMRKPPSSSPMPAAPN